MARTKAQPQKATDCLPGVVGPKQKTTRKRLELLAGRRIEDWTVALLDQSDFDGPTDATGRCR